MKKHNTPFDNLEFTYFEYDDIIGLRVKHKIFNLVLHSEMLYTTQVKYTINDLWINLYTTFYKIYNYQKAKTFQNGITVCEWDKEKNQWFMLDKDNNKIYESNATLT